MRALRFHGRKDLRVDNIPPPVPTDKQVLVQVEWCGLCGSDLHEYSHGPMYIPTAERPNALTGDSLPITMGHEFCGRIAEAPKGSKLKKRSANNGGPTTLL